MWDYFSYNVDCNKSVCQIEVNSSTCGKHISGKKLQQHMKLSHLSTFNEYLESEKHKLQTKPPSNLSTLKNVFVRQALYSSDSHQ